MSRLNQPTALFTSGFLIGILLAGCSMRKAGVNSQDETFSRDSFLLKSKADDPFDKSLPFTLKSMESVLTAVPDHPGLLVAAAAQFVLHGQTYILQSSAGKPCTNEHAKKRRHVAKSVFLRARAYGMRALEENHQGFQEAVARDLRNAMAQTTIQEAPALYWTGMALAAAISVDREDRVLLAQQPIAQGFLLRAGELDESFKHRPLSDYFGFGAPAKESASQRHFFETLAQPDPVREVGGTQ